MSESDRELSRREFLERSLPVGDGKVDSLFTRPDALRKAVEAGAKGA